MGNARNNSQNLFRADLASGAPTSAAVASRFDSVDCVAAQAELDRLLSEVAAGCGRVEITGSTSNSTCVLISFAELRGLERALEILSGTEGAQAMREQIESVVAAAAAQQISTRTPLMSVLAKSDSPPAA